MASLIALPLGLLCQTRLPIAIRASTNASPRQSTIQVSQIHTRPHLPLMRSGAKVADRRPTICHLGALRASANAGQFRHLHVAATTFCSVSATYHWREDKKNSKVKQVRLKTSQEQSGKGQKKVKSQPEKSFVAAAPDVPLPEVPLVTSANSWEQSLVQAQLSPAFLQRLTHMQIMAAQMMGCSNVTPKRCSL